MTDFKCHEVKFLDDILIGQCITYTVVMKGNLSPRKSSWNLHVFLYCKPIAKVWVPAHRLFVEEFLPMS